MLEWIRLIIGAIFLLIGLIIFACEIFGVFRFDYLLNRMHVAAIGDTLGIFPCLLGLMIISGFSVATLKMLIVIASLWCTSPVASHLISKMEIETRNGNDNRYEVATVEQVEQELAARKDA